MYRTWIYAFKYTLKTILQLKQFGGWKSDKAAEGYYRSGVRNKNSDANTFNEVIGVKEKDTYNGTR